MKKSQISLAIFLIATGMFLMAGLAEAAGDCKEHPLIRPWPGSELEPTCKYNNFNEHAFRVTDEKTGKTLKKTVQGKFWSLKYILYDANRGWDATHSVLEYRMNYKQAALEKGGTVLFEDQGYLTFTLPGDDGSTTWCEVHIWNKSMQDLRIIEVAGMKKTMTFGPTEMKAALDAEGRVQLHGILFDLDRATLQPKSTKQLQDIVTLMKDQPGLKIEVQGHTDDQGEDDYNLDLSQRRAEAVVAYLRLFGVDTGRLVPKGYGEAKPVMANTTEKGRAKNRRVELVKMP